MYLPKDASKTRKKRGREPPEESSRAKNCHEQWHGHSTRPDQNGDHDDYGINGHEEWLESLCHERLCTGHRNSNGHAAKRRATSRKIQGVE